MLVDYIHAQVLTTFNDSFLICRARENGAARDLTAVLDLELVKSSLAMAMTS